jgi:hypothetical protein
MQGPCTCVFAQGRICACTHAARLGRRRACSETVPAGKANEERIIRMVSCVIADDNGGPEKSEGRSHSVHTQPPHWRAESHMGMGRK